MMEAISHILQWFSLVAPAVGVCAGLLFLVRGWLHRSFGHYCLALVAGLAAIALIFTGLSLVTKYWVLSRIAACERDPLATGCHVIEYQMAYPVMVGLLTFVLFLVGVVIVGIVRLTRGLRLGKRATV